MDRKWLFLGFESVGFILVGAFLGYQIEKKFDFNGLALIFFLFLSFFLFLFKVYKQLRKKK